MIKLGQTVTDSITGFTGVAYSRIEFLTGVTQIGVQGRAIDNVIPAILYLDEDRLLATVPQLAMMKAGVTIEP